MRHIGKILVIAGTLLAAGVIIAGSSFGIAKNRAKTEAESMAFKYEDKEYTVKDVEALDEINVSMTAEDIMIIESDDNDLVIRYRDITNGDPIYRIEEKNGSLKITRRAFDIAENNNFHFYDFEKIVMNEWSHDEEEVCFRIYVPKKYKGEYSIASISGIIEMSDVDVTGNLEAAATSGEINIDRVNVSGDLDVSTVSGKITVKNLESAGEQNIATTSGDIDLENVTSGDEADYGSISGAIMANGLVINDISASTTSGDVNLGGVKLGRSMEIGTISGAAEIEFDDSKDDFSVTTETVSGDVSVACGENKGSTKRVEISTTSGSINVDFAE